MISKLTRLLHGCIFAAVQPQPLWSRIQKALYVVAHSIQLPLVLKPTGSAL